MSNLLYWCIAAAVAALSAWLILRGDRRRTAASSAATVLGVVFFEFLFFGFMLRPCLNTLTSIFTAKKGDPFAVIRFFFAGSMPTYVWNSLKLAVCLVLTVNLVGVCTVLFTEYFDIKGAKILRLGYMTTLIYSGVALVTGYQFLYDRNGIITSWLAQTLPKILPGVQFNKQWFSGFGAVLFTMTFACTSNHMLFLRNAIRGIDYNTVEAARNLGAKPFTVLWRVVLPTLLPTLFSLTVMTFITGLCAMSAPTLLGYNSINPEIVRLAGSTVTDEAFPQARAALLSIILALFTIVLLTVLSSYERKGHYLSVSKTKAKLVKQKITNPVANALCHIAAYVMWIIYMTPVAMILVFAFQNYGAIAKKTLDWKGWTLINFWGRQSTTTVNDRGKTKVVEDAVTGVFSNPDTFSSIWKSTWFSLIASLLVCVIVLLAVSFIFKNRNKKSSTVLEYSMLFPWLLPTILICYSYRTYFAGDGVWYLFGRAMYPKNVDILLILAYTVVKLPFALRMIKASFYAIDDELEDAARNLGSRPLHTFFKVKLPIVIPSVAAVFALTFNALFTEYDMSATFRQTKSRTFAMVLQSMTNEEFRRGGRNLNADGRRLAATVFIMLVSGVMLYIAYGLPSKDLSEKLAAREKRRRFANRLLGRGKGE